jgi:ribokinase
MRRIQNAAIVLLQLEAPLDSASLAIERARQSGVPVMLDPAPAMQLPTELLKSVDWLTPNETESCALLTLSPDSPELAARLTAEKLLALGVRNVALKLGAKGVFLAGQDVAPCFVPGVGVQAIDTTAAGDIFNGAFAMRLAQTGEPFAAASYANVVAGMSVTRYGAQSSMPSADEVTVRIYELSLQQQRY